MILPTKHLEGNRALLTIGAGIIHLLYRPKPISRLWDDLKLAKDNEVNSSTLTYSWFILALDLLYLLKAIELRDDGMIQLTNYDSPNI